MKGLIMVISLRGFQFSRLCSGITICVTSTISDEKCTTRSSIPFTCICCLCSVLLLLWLSFGVVIVIVVVAVVVVFSNDGYHYC